MPKALDADRAKALAREPEDRYANASDLLRDLESVLYSYTPAPGSADLAIFLHRLQAEETAVAEAKAREAARAVPEAEVEQKPRRAKAAPVARRTGTVPKRPRPRRRLRPGARGAARGRGGRRPRPGTAPGVFGSYASRPGEPEAKSRTALYRDRSPSPSLVLGAGIYWLTTRKSAPPVVPRPTPAPRPPRRRRPCAVPTAAPTIDPKKVEEEVQRQMAPEEEGDAEGAGREEAGGPRRRLPQRPAPEAEAVPAGTHGRTGRPTAPRPPPRAEPHRGTDRAAAPPTAVPAPPRAAPAAPRAEVAAAISSGPGPGVVEPELLGKPKIDVPADRAAGRHRRGRVVVLVLVDEEGGVAEASLQQGVAPKSGVNEAVIDAVQKAKFRPATKNGVPGEDVASGRRGRETMIVAVGLQPVSARLQEGK